MVTILSEQETVEIPSARTDGGLWLGKEDLQRATGFELKPEGLCKGAICVPIPKGEASFAHTLGAVDLERFWSYMGHPIVHDRARTTWALGTGAGTRTEALESLEAPDFTLPDLDGKPHSLSDYRGRKVFLATWASW